MASFTKPKRNLRKRQHSSESDEEPPEDQESIQNDPELVRELQKQRQRQRGVSAASLALGKKIPKTEEITDADPFKVQTGGFVDMKALKLKPLTGEAAEAIGTAFAAETNRRDEDAEMLKFVEVELAKKKGKELKDKEDLARLQKPDDGLYQLPDNLKVPSSAKKSEDMLSNQMLSGIPEIDLGIEAKIKNIEATEDAKQKLLAERLRQKDNEISQFVPTNIAANFVQHNRFNIDSNSTAASKAAPDFVSPQPLRVGGGLRNSDAGVKPRLDEKATDDFHYEKFKKQMRRF